MALSSSSHRKNGKKVRGSTSSRLVHHLSSSKTPGGRNIPLKESLNATDIIKRQAHDKAEHDAKLQSLTTAQHRELQAIHLNLPANDENDVSLNAWIDVDDVLSGTTSLDLSHAGGEFAGMVDLAEDMLVNSKR
jgi:hypothetical protein